MNKVNITEYKGNAKSVCYGKATLYKDFQFADGDEFFYKFIGENSCHSMIELLHPDDVAGFRKTVDMIKGGVQYAIVRMKNAKDEYRLLYLTLKENGEVIDDFAIIEMEFCDFMETKERYSDYKSIIRKYHEFMTLSTQMFFEYQFDTDEFMIYYYMDEKNYPVLQRKLEDVENAVDAKRNISDKSKAEFDTLVNTIRNGVDRFDMTVNSEVIENNSGYIGRYNIKGSTMYDNGEKTMVVGLIAPVSGDSMQKSYYLTEGALDPGTGILNKRAINEYALDRLQKCKKENNRMYMAIMDIDDFKLVNDKCGHLVGDEVIFKAAEIFKNVIGSRGMLGRFGGDEFMIIIDGVETEEELKRILKTISKNLTWALRSLKDRMLVTTSCGISCFPEDGHTYEELFMKADRALYIAKDKGKNRYVIYDDKKHGKMTGSRSLIRNSGLRAIASSEKKTEIMSEIMLDLHRNGKSALLNAMEKMMSYFDIDGVAIYQGSRMKRVMSKGKYVNAIQELQCMNDRGYRTLFDEQGVYAESTIERLDTIYPMAYKMYESQENGEFIQFAAFDGGMPMAVVAFDFFNRAPKIGANDMNLMRIVGRMMAEIAGENW